MKALLTAVSATLFLVLIGPGTLLLSSCNPEEVPPTSFTAKIDGKEFEFEDPEIVMSWIDNQLFFQKIHGSINVDGHVKHALTILLGGGLVSDNSNGFLVYVGRYYQNDYKDFWSFYSPYSHELDNLNITITEGNRGSGEFIDFKASGDLGSVLIKDIFFYNVPISIEDF